MSLCLSLSVALCMNGSWALFGGEQRDDDDSVGGFARV